MQLKDFINQTIIDTVNSIPTGGTIIEFDIGVNPVPLSSKLPVTEWGIEVNEKSLNRIKFNVDLREK